jgi:hypothetical protein
MRGPSKFKKSDVIRAASAVRAAGLEIARVAIAPDGSIIVEPGRQSEAIQNDQVPEDLRKLL